MIFFLIFCKTLNSYFSVVTLFCIWPHSRQQVESGDVTKQRGIMGDVVFAAIAFNFSPG